MLLLAHLLRLNPEWSDARLTIRSIARSETERDTQRLRQDVAGTGLRVDRQPHLAGFRIPGDVFAQLRDLPGGRADVGGEAFDGWLAKIHGERRLEPRALDLEHLHEGGELFTTPLDRASAAGLVCVPNTGDGACHVGIRPVGIAGGGRS